MKRSGKIMLGSAEGWVMIRRPSVITESLRQEEWTFIQQRNRDFRRMHEEFRSIYQEHFDRIPSDRAKTATELIEYFCERRESYFDVLLIPLFTRATTMTISHRGMKLLIERNEPWRLYLIARIHALYSRAVQASAFGHDRNAGFAGLESAIYLPFADVFVTFDRAQYEAMLEINKFNRSRETSIVWYGDLVN